MKTHNEHTQTKQLDPRQKALQINLNQKIYGTLAEIGAGQEVSSIFFKAGGASGTIAKTMSAYDMTFSDAIYGKEESGRYVCEPRVMRMLKKEYDLLEMRLTGVRSPDTLFFAYSNTVVALNYKKDNEGHGWMGVRFQLNPSSPPNDVVIHIRMLDNDTLQQQQAVGVVGINLIYACYYYYMSTELFIKSLVDNVGSERIEVDMIRITGPDFGHVDNRLLSLQLVNSGLTNAALFDPSGNVLQPSEAFYKKNLMVIRGRFRPTTYVNLDMFQKGMSQFKQDKDVDPNNCISLAELTLNNLSNEGQIDERDFLDRADILCSMGQSVLISNYHEYYRLIAYLSRLTRKKIGLVLGIISLKDIFEESYYKHLKGGILESFATLFSQNVKLYIYPTRDKDSGDIHFINDFKLANNLVDLFKYLLANDKLEDIKGAHTEYLHIYSDNVIKMIKANEDGWQTMVPAEVREAIENKNLFGYKQNTRVY